MLDEFLIAETLENGKATHGGGGLAEFPAEAVTQRDYELMVGPDGRIAVQMAQVEIDTIDSLEEGWRHKFYEVLMIPEYLISLVHVLGVTLEPIPTVRQQRRAFNRRWGIAYPQLYFVNLRGAGETFPGHGDREYRHRWLVRGHYRRHPLGELVVPNKGPCTWVRPYVKGPPGAPWKGRAVYVA